jgi:superfamily II DNA or RNA helicase
MIKLSVSNSFVKCSDLSEKERASVKALLTYKVDFGAQKLRLVFKMKAMQRKAQTCKSAKQAGFFKAMVQKTYQEIEDIKKKEIVCWFRDDAFPTGHLELVKNYLSKKEYQFVLDDLRIVPKKTHIYKWVNQPEELRYYQKEIIAKCLAESRGVIESAVSSGKTLMMTCVIKEMGVKTLLVVPSSALSKQIYDEVSNYLGKHMVEIVDTKKVRAKADLKPIRIVTIQSLASLNKTKDIGHILKGVDCVMGDEFHHWGSKSATDLLPHLDSVYSRIGWTGTFMRNDSSLLDLYGILSNVLHRYPAYQGVKDGFLTPIIKVNHELSGTLKLNYQKEYDENYCGNPDMLGIIKKILIEMAVDKQVLILINKKDKSGNIIHKFLKAEGFECSYISGDNSKEEINDTIKKFNAKKINILIGSSVIGEGVNVRSTDHLILAQGGKSEIAIVQAIGRLVRLYEGKEYGYLHDFCFQNTKYMLKHYNMRTEIIKRVFNPEKEIICV